MALTQFAFGVMPDASATGENLGAMEFSSLVIENIAPTGTSAATTAVAPEPGTRPVCRIATDTTVHVTFGATPTATAATGILCLAGTVTYVIVNVDDKAAVITP